MIILAIIPFGLLFYVAYQQYKFNNQAIKDCEQFKKDTGWDIEIKLG